MPDLDEAVWQHVLKKAPDEFIRRQGDGIAVLGGETDAAVSVADESCIRYSDAVGIPAQVFEEVLSAPKRALAVGIPIEAEELVFEPTPMRLRLRFIPLGPQDEAAGIVELLQSRHVFGSEETRKNQHWKQVVTLDVEPPLRAFDRQTTGGDDAVGVGVELQLTGPSMKYRRDTELNPQSPWVTPKLKQRLCCRAEQQRICRFTVEMHNTAELCGECEDNVEMAHGQNASLPVGDPYGLRNGLARRAMPVAAGIELIRHHAAIVTHASMPAEQRRPTSLNGTHDLGLRLGHTVAFSIRRSVPAKDVADMKACPPLLLVSRGGFMCWHDYARRLRPAVFRARLAFASALGLGLGVGRASKGLLTAATWRLLTRVYRAVVRIELCPSTTCMTRISVPLSSKCVAKAWRSECGVTRLSMPTSLAARLSDCRIVAGATCRSGREPSNKYSPCGLDIRQYPRKHSSSRGLRPT